MIVALLQEGETVAAWLYDPLDGCLCSAERGAGAFRDGQRVHAERRDGGLRGIVKTRFLPPGLKQRVLDRTASCPGIHAGVNAAGVEYPAIARGDTDFALYWRTLPWDHAGPALWLQEAGGHAARPDGTPYRPAEPRDGLLAAADRTTWDAARSLLGF